MFHLEAGKKTRRTHARARAHEPLRLIKFTSATLASHPDELPRLRRRAALRPRQPVNKAGVELVVGGRGRGAAFTSASNFILSYAVICDSLRRLLFTALSLLCLENIRLFYTFVCLSMYYEAEPSGLETPPPLPPVLPLELYLRLLGFFFPFLLSSLSFLLPLTATIYFVLYSSAHKLSSHAEGVAGFCI